MKKIPKELVVLVGVALLICVLLAIISISSKNGGAVSDEGAAVVTVTETTTEDVASVDPIELPDTAPIEEVLGFEPMQVKKLSEKFVLRTVDIVDNGVIYNYQKDLAANGARLFLKINKMTEEEYNASLPAESVRQNIEIDGRNTVFADRILYKVPNEEELAEDSVERVQEKEGTAVVEHSDLYKELAPMQTLDWYENGCKFELYAEHLSLTAEDMTELVHNYFTNGE